MGKVFKPSIEEDAFRWKKESTRHRRTCSRPPGSAAGPGEDQRRSRIPAEPLRNGDHRDAFNLASHQSVCSSHRMVAAAATTYRGGTRWTRRGRNSGCRLSRPEERGRLGAGGRLDSLTGRPGWRRRRISSGGGAHRCHVNMLHIHTGAQHVTEELLLFSSLLITRALCVFSLFQQCVYV